MNKQFLRFIFFLLIYLTLPPTATAQAIDFPDPNLRAAVEKALGKASGATITTSDLAALRSLTARESNISDLTGLEHAINLTSLDLGRNSISDITSLSGLTKLTWLYLLGNSISNITSLSELINLTLLYLGYNLISDISAVSGLTNLTRLHLGNNSISDITSLSGLINLTLLYLGSNSISDISAVSDLTNLRTLGIWDNNISDISAVSGLTDLTALSLGGNLISDISAVSGLTDLTALSLGGNLISDISAVSSLTNLTYLYLGGNLISDISTVSGLTNLTHLYLGGNLISDISTVSSLTNLTWLYLMNNSVSDISAVSGLINLTELGVGGNSVSDISAVSGLTNLKHLSIPNNSVSDISAISGLTNLTGLHLQDNSVSDISAVSGLINLKWLGLWNNSVSDISPLVKNTGLVGSDEVHIRGNPLSYLSIHTHIPALQSRGVTVGFDDQAHPALLKVSGDNQEGMPKEMLAKLLVIEAQDAAGSPLVGIRVTFTVVAGGGTLSTTNTMTDANGRAQSLLTLGPNLGTQIVSVFATGIEVPVTFHAIADTELLPITVDVNRDGNVNIFDLVLVASALGSVGVDLAADVNGDEVVDILDLVLVAGMFDGAAAAPSAQPQVPETPTAVEVQGWLTDARSLEIRDPIMKRGFLVLEQLLVSLTPTETELLANYPNPFNPETWIPYQLAEEAFVTLTIYDGSGRAVRTLDVGHRIASAYESRSKAIYWDGRNDVGEQVASGVYFYTLTAGNFSATRKMLILK